MMNLIIRCWINIKRLRCERIEQNFNPTAAAGNVNVIVPLAEALENVPLELLVVRA
jgi:hypothetical protein